MTMTVSSRPDFLASVDPTGIPLESLRALQIRGRRDRVYRNFDGSYIRYLQVVPLDPLLPVIRFQKFYAFDAAFYAWYDDLPDLDNSDRTRIIAREPM